jgi:hypothetical protein
MKNSKKEKDKYWRCVCGEILGEFIGSGPHYHRIKILGVNCKDYEIGFIYIETFCKKCGKKNYIKSDIMVDTDIDKILVEKDGVFPEEVAIKYWWEMPSYHKNLLLKELSKTQKIILGAVIKNKDDNPDKIYKIVNLPWKKVWDDLVIIMEKVRKIVPRRDIPLWK